MAQCKHPRVQIVAREEDAEFVECLECGEIFESSEFKDMAIEDATPTNEPESLHAGLAQTNWRTRVLIRVSTVTKVTEADVLCPCRQLNSLLVSARGDPCPQRRQCHLWLWWSTIPC